MESMTERFIRYCRMNTRSDENSTTIPSTPLQAEFAQMLTEELRIIGLADVQLHPESYFVTATLPSNTDKDVPAIGFISHYDTADYNADHIQPRIVRDYDGRDIVLNEELGIIMKAADFPKLAEYKGLTLVTTDGTTLLGADDKAGVSEILEAMIHLLNHPEILHGKIRIAFGPDEEVGLGADHFDTVDFGTDFAYTLDGADLGELEYECFNAAQANIRLHGVSVHPGTAKGLMINTSKLALEFDSQLPQDAVPEKTENYEGFFMLQDIRTTIDDGEMTYIIRDHDRTEFENKKAQIATIGKQMNEKYGRSVVEIEMHDQYYNMADIIRNDMQSVDLAVAAMKSIGIEPIVKPIRGGTDGSKISFMGIPTPNLFVGGDNFHGQYEVAIVEYMEKAVQLIVRICEMNGYGKTE
ncbi:MAG: peptidase T [Saccharofermentanales bacterium]